MQALRTAADFYARYEDYKTAATLLSLLLQVQPRNFALDAELGHCQFRAGDSDAAEKTLLRAREHKIVGPTALEELARIRLARHDDRGALGFLEETLALDARNADLWFTRADVATRLGDTHRIEESLEKGLAIEPANWNRRTALVELYVSRNAADPAFRHIQIVSAALPPDAAVRRKYAEYLDRLGRPQDALEMWRKALESDPAMEQAHYRIARLLLDRNDTEASLAASNRGLETSPKAARLYLLKAEAQERQGHYFDARQTLRAASGLGDAALLSRLAEMEDASGQGAAQTYANLLALTAGSASQPEIEHTLERGLETALRDGDARRAAEFRSALSAAARQALPGRFLSSRVAETFAVVPGGLEGLQFVARFHSKSPQRFFADYCRKLIDRTALTSKEEAALYIESIRRYFQLVAALKTLGTSKNGRTTFALSAADKKARQQTEKVLDLLGWKLRFKKDEITLEAGEKGAQARRQETASALAIDEVGMQEALQAGQAFHFEIADAKAAVLLDPVRWNDTFFPKETFGGGFAEALTHDLRVAKIYCALSAMDVRAVPILSAGTDLKLLAERYADLLFRYSSSFALNGVRAAVPGGTPAEPVWEKLLGAPVSNPSRFFRALLDKDEGKLLAFFSLLGQLDTDHQKFLTRTASRTSRFYELFRDSRDVARGAEKQAQSSSFVEFLREIPLDSEDRVLFPGSPEVWVLAKGSSSSVTQTTKMAKKLARVTVPEAEDEILLRLAKTRYSTSLDKNNESDNFIAVARIDAHRDDPLDDTSALLLAQHYASYRALYPYFASLTAVTAPQFERFFAFIEPLRNLPRLQANTVLGHVHSLLALLCLAQESGAISPPAAAQVFGSLSARFAKSAGDGAYAAAALESLRDLLDKVKSDPAAGPDHALERALLGDAAPVTFELDGVRHTLDPAALRRAAYRKVLAAQKVTSLQTLLEFYNAIRELSAGKAPAAGLLDTLDRLQPGLLTVEVPKTLNLKKDSEEYRILNEFAPAKVTALMARLKQQSSRKKVNRDEVSKLCQELMAAIAPQVKLALMGPVYAYYLKPDDLLVSQDPLLLRKHQFFDMSPGDHVLFPPSALQPTSEGAGSYLLGGFADLPGAAGEVALSGRQSDPNVEFVAGAQIGSLRSSDWSRLNEHDLIRFEVRLRVAREWIIHASTDDRLLAGLTQDIEGLLPPTRTGTLLDATASRDWDEAFKTLTLGDLFQLSSRYLDRYSKDLWQSPAIAALRKSGDAPGDERLRSLGSSAVRLLGCSHPHLAPAGPYEEYEKLMLPFKLAERTAEFKLYLADLAARLGLPPAALNAIGEPLAMAILSKTHMTDIRDWQSALSAFAALDPAMVAASLPKEQ